jgi:hypothetical protein
MRPHRRPYKSLSTGAYPSSPRTSWHPSLRSKPWPPHGADCYQANLTQGWRFYYQRQGDEAVVYWMQKHPKKGG